MDAKFAQEKHGAKKVKKKGLGWSWASFGRGLGRSWASCGRSWGFFGRSWGALGVLLGRSWGQELPRGPQGPQEGIKSMTLGALGGLLGALLALLESPLGWFNSFLGPLGASWGLFWRSWGALGALLGVLGSFLGVSVFEVAFWSDFFAFVIVLGWIWEGFRDEFRRFFAFFANITILWKSLFLLGKIAIFKDSSF